MAAMPAQTVRTMCPMNCHPTLCGMLADVDDGKLVAVRGDEANPDSQGFLCVRGLASPAHIAVSTSLADLWLTVPLNRSVCAMSWASCLGEMGDCAMSV